MTRVRLRSRPGRRDPRDLVIVPVTDRLEQVATEVGPVLGSEAADLLRSTPGFTGRTGDAVRVLAIPRGETAPRSLLVVGVGAQGPTPAALAVAAMAAGREAVGHRVVETSLAAAATDVPAAIRAVVEGFWAGAYRYRDAADPELALLLPAAAARRTDVRRALEVAQVAAEATTWVRRVVDTPAGELTPPVLADAIRARAKVAGVGARVWTAATLRSRGFGGTLGVGSGSASAPVAVELTWGSGPPRIGLAGKGITFDAGGLNLKQDATEIRWMKSDMAAAASVAAAVCAAGSLEVGCSVRAVLPLAENSVGERSIRPGDVVSHPDGRRTEVLDTDSEGRLVLADAIAYLARAGVEEVVDVGTLTDGGGLGHLLWGCWGNDTDLVRDLVVAGETTGDPGWTLPLRAEYRSLLGSDVADVTNVSREVPDSAMLAATYLSTFADGVRWAHIDNGSTAYLDSALDPWPRGATGSPTRALLEFLMTRATGRRSR